MGSGERIALPEIKISYKALVSNGMWGGCRDRLPGNRIERPETETYIRRNLIMLYYVNIVS